ncbi:MAG: RecX family transcriptional regulator [Candidatus Riflebacteria bacterium]|nr:RecX family transcriptional regulator [Candidatus Riflebacteria bacterium]
MKPSRPVEPLDQLVRMLARRDLSRDEARRRLLSLELDPDQVEEALEQAVARRWLDDRRLAENFIRKALEADLPPSRELLEERLAARGVPPEIAGPTLDQGLGSDWNRTLRERLKRYVLSRVDRGHPARLFGRLARQGFGIDEVREAFAACGVDLDDENDPRTVA